MMVYDREPSFTIGIEEEYLLVDPISRDLAVDPPTAILEQCNRQVCERVTPEFLRAQIEVQTKVCHSIAEARADLANCRACICEVARAHDLAVIAAATHPFADWDRQLHTDKERYKILARDMQTIARRLLICGLHVHVGIADDDLRIDLMNQVGYFLPHLLALSTSGPFWEGRNTGLKSYRVAVWSELPRTGLPPRFESFAEYRRLADRLIGAGAIEDGTKLWWDIRPSDRFPTIEMRMTDVCTRLEDTISIAALYLCLLRMLWRLRKNNQRWRIYEPILVEENRWRAQRYGFDEGLIDFGRGAVVPYQELLEEIIDLVEEDAYYFDCRAEVEHSRAILQRGTSADRQLAVFAAARTAGKDDREALKDVVDLLIEETAAGL